MGKTINLDESTLAAIKAHEGSIRQTAKDLGLSTLIVRRHKEPSNNKGGPSRYLTQPITGKWALKIKELDKPVRSKLYDVQRGCWVKGLPK